MGSSMPDLIHNNDEIPPVQHLGLRSYHPYRTLTCLGFAVNRCNNYYFFMYLKISLSSLPYHLSILTMQPEVINDEIGH